MPTLYNELEQRVAERTSELVAANSALRQIQSDLRETDRRKDQFLAMLGHELRNPLAAISNAAPVLQELGPAQADLNWCREVIERQSEHLTRLVNDLLDVSRVSRGKIQLEMRLLDLAVATREAVEGCRSLVNSRRHDLVLSLPPGPVFVEGDRTRLAQVVANLVNNAAKYTDKGGRIEVTVEKVASDREYAVLRVRDNGRGMDA